MPSITFDAHELAAIASLHQATPQVKSERQITPVLGFIQLTVTPTAGVDSTADGDPIPGGWDVVAVATDRYMVGRIRWTIPMPTDGTEPRVLGADDGPVTVTLDSLHLKDAAATAKKTREQFHALSWEQHESGTGDSKPATLRTGGSTLVIATGGHFNYPPVSRLIPDYSDLVDTPEVAINLHRVARIAKISAPVYVHGASELAWKLQSTGEPWTSTSGKPKPKPVIFRMSERGVDVCAILQPNLILS
jgi:hypothetical protein